MRRILTAALIAAVLLVPAAWQPATAQSGNTWTGYYYNNPNWSGTPVYTDSSQFLSYNWGTGSPSPAVPVDNFTATYESDVYFYAGTYGFSATADDEITVIVGGITIIDTAGQAQSGKTITANMTFQTASTQQITVYYREYTDLAYVYLNWSLLKGGGGAPPPPPPPVPTPPPSQCTPQSATSVQTQYGNYTPCIQSGEHQSACFQSNGAWNAPNMGSIQSEPQIQIWGNCTADSITTFQVSCDPNDPPKQYKCSKTEAGWFPN